MVPAGFEFLGNEITKLYKAEGVARVIIPREKAISSTSSDLEYYDCFLKFNTGNIVVKASVISLKNVENVEVEQMFGVLNLVTSPYIARCFAYGTGLEEFSEGPFLIVPRFKSTLVTYIDVNLDSAKKTLDKQRFTEDFIAIMRHVVYGIFTLHKQGFYCPKLEAKHILVFSADTTKTAKIWKFTREVNESKKLKDWTRLGLIIQDGMKMQLVSTSEINDLCTGLLDGRLQGLQILKHSALLTVQQKFENILALNLYILVHSSDDFTSASQDPGKSEAVADLKEFIKARHLWVSMIPEWITMTSGYNSKPINTGGSFVIWLRDRVEHELSFIPEKDRKKKSSTYSKIW